MKRARWMLSLMIIVGLLTAISGSAQTGGAVVGASPPGDRSDLGLVILVNRLELTPPQMQTMHDLLVEVLDEANGLKERGEAFAQEMIRFHGSTDELNVLLEAFRNEQSAQVTALRKTVSEALDELKGLLTIKQGEIIKKAFTQRFGAQLPPRAMGRESLARGPKGVRAQEPEGPPMHMRSTDRLCERAADEGALPERLRELLSSHPELRKRLADWEEPGNDHPFGLTGESFGIRPFEARLLGDRALSRLEQVANILAMKLQYIE